MGKIFTDWDDTHSELWSHQPIRLEHSMHTQPAFSMDELARLIEVYPREHYSLVKTGARGSSRVWREGEIGKLSGRQVIEAISRGGLWLNLRNVTAVDFRYRDLIDRMFAEIATKVRGFEVPTHQAGILISSPDAQVYYHADLPGQGLIQIAGRKRVYIYPNTAPFIRPEHLESIALFDVEVDIPYADWYDRHAQVIDLEPGQMLNWPLNAPHRVENLGTVNVSMTVSYVDDDIRRAQILHLANGMLRHRFGYTPKSRNIRGPSFFAKQVMQKLLRDGKWVKRERSVRRPIDFRLDEAYPGKIVDLRAAA
ncbi:cupin-like domain-containing protein [Bradyrhizobium jicamae]|uniref:Cupin-like domain-containing protein n=2 Tax=Bradyrhizobium jicamae TaxID=280332 RepID=A0ABS5FJV0_9BRAD|nr:cupin-like domain-containing protein [Bradyrhizobium jicamae]MBR0937673.1 cupin-like domain-containing protein [Bradyrhizobium jicamae]